MISKCFLFVLHSHIPFVILLTNCLLFSLILFFQMIYLMIIFSKMFMNYFMLLTCCLLFSQPYLLSSLTKSAGSFSDCPGIYVVDSHKNSNKKYNHFLLELFGLFSFSVLFLRVGNST